MPAYRSEPARAAARFARDCARCHGPRGGGDGVFGRAMLPPPTSFLDRDYMDQQRPSYYHDAIVDGVTGTGMPSWGHALDDESAWDMAFYVWALALPDAALETGQVVYARDCASCHAVDGTGVAGHSFADPLRVDATRAEDAVSLRELHPDLAASLTADEQRSVVEYLWTFLYRPEALQDSGR